MGDAGARLSTMGEHMMGGSSLAIEKVMEGRQVEFLYVESEACRLPANLMIARNSGCLPYLKALAAGTNRATVTLNLSRTRIRSFLDQENRSRREFETAHEKYALCNARCRAAEIIRGENIACTAGEEKH